MTRISTTLLPSLLLVLVAGCDSPAATPSGSHTAATPAETRTIDSVVPDTHILDLADSTEVWLIPGRVARAGNGAPCLERGLQLRKGPLKITVPLLYTSALPVVVDGKLIASVSNNCVSGQMYSIDAVTGQPTKWERRSR
jgi:hypothetical protein